MLQQQHPAAAPAADCRTVNEAATARSTSPGTAFLTNSINMTNSSSLYSNIPGPTRDEEKKESPVESFSVTNAALLRRRSNCSNSYTSKTSSSSRQIQALSQNREISPAALAAMALSTAEKHLPTGDRTSHIHGTGGAGAGTAPAAFVLCSSSWPSSNNAAAVGPAAAAVSRASPCPVNTQAARAATATSGRGVAAWGRGAEAGDGGAARERAAPGREGEAARIACGLLSSSYALSAAQQQPFAAHPTAGVSRLSISSVGLKGSRYNPARGPAACTGFARAWIPARNAGEGCTATPVAAQGYLLFPCSGERATAAVRTATPSTSLRALTPVFGTTGRYREFTSAYTPPFHQRKLTPLARSSSSFSSSFSCAIYQRPFIKSVSGTSACTSRFDAVPASSAFAATFFRAFLGPPRCVNSNNSTCARSRSTRMRSSSDMIRTSDNGSSGTSSNSNCGDEIWLNSDSSNSTVTTNRSSNSSKNTNRNSGNNSDSITSNSTGHISSHSSNNSSDSDSSEAGSGRQKGECCSSREASSTRCSDGVSRHMRECDNGTGRGSRSSTRCRRKISTDSKAVGAVCPSNGSALSSSSSSGWRHPGNKPAASSSSSRERGSAHMEDNKETRSPERGISVQRRGSSNSITGVREKRRRGRRKKTNASSNSSISHLDARRYSSSSGSCSGSTRRRNSTESSSSSRSTRKRRGNTLSHEQSSPRAVLTMAVAEVTAAAVRKSSATAEKTEEGAVQECFQPMHSGCRQKTIGGKRRASFHQGRVAARTAVCEISVHKRITRLLADKNEIGAHDPMKRKAVACPQDRATCKNDVGSASTESDGAAMPAAEKGRVNRSVFQRRRSHFAVVTSSSLPRARKDMRAGIPSIKRTTNVVSNKDGCTNIKTKTSSITSDRKSVRFVKGFIQKQWGITKNCMRRGVETRHPQQDARQQKWLQQQQQALQEQQQHTLVEQEQQQHTLQEQQQASRAQHLDDQQGSLAQQTQPESYGATQQEANRLGSDVARVEVLKAASPMRKEQRLVAGAVGDERKAAACFRRSNTKPVSLSTHVGAVNEAREPPASPASLALYAARAVTPPPRAAYVAASRAQASPSTAAFPKASRTAVLRAAALGPGAVQRSPQSMSPATGLAAANTFARALFPSAVATGSSVIRHPSPVLRRAWSVCYRHSKPAALSVKKQQQHWTTENNRIYMQQQRSPSAGRTAAELSPTYASRAISVFDRRRQLHADARAAPRVLDAAAQGEEVLCRTVGVTPSKRRPASSLAVRIEQTTMHASNGETTHSISSTDSQDPRGRAATDIKAARPPQKQGNSSDLHTFGIFVSPLLGAPVRAAATEYASAEDRSLGIRAPQGSIPITHTSTQEEICRRKSPPVTSITAASACGCSCAASDAAAAAAVSIAESPPCAREGIASVTTAAASLHRGKSPVDATVAPPRFSTAAAVASPTETSVAAAACSTTSTNTAAATSLLEAGVHVSPTATATTSTGVAASGENIALESRKRNVAGPCRSPSALHPGHQVAVTNPNTEAKEAAIVWGRGMQHCGAMKRRSSAGAVDTSKEERAALQRLAAAGVSPVRRSTPGHLRRRHARLVKPEISTRCVTRAAAGAARQAPGYNVGRLTSSGPQQNVVAVAHTPTPPSAPAMAQTSATPRVPAAALAAAAATAPASGAAAEAQVLAAAKAATAATAGAAKVTRAAAVVGPTASTTAAAATACPQAPGAAPVVGASADTSETAWSSASRPPAIAAGPEEAGEELERAGSEAAAARKEGRCRIKNRKCLGSQRTEMVQQSITPESSSFCSPSSSVCSSKHITIQQRDAAGDSHRASSFCSASPTPSSSTKYLHAASPVQEQDVLQLLKNLPASPYEDGFCFLECAAAAAEALNVEGHVTGIPSFSSPTKVAAGSTSAVSAAVECAPVASAAAAPIVTGAPASGVSETALTASVSYLRAADAASSSAAAVRANSASRAAVTSPSVTNSSPGKAVAARAAATCQISDDAHSPPLTPSEVSAADSAAAAPASVDVAAGRRRSTPRSGSVFSVAAASAASDASLKAPGASDAVAANVSPVRAGISAGRDRKLAPTVSLEEYIQSEVGTNPAAVAAVFRCAAAVLAAQQPSFFMHAAVCSNARSLRRDSSSSSSLISSPSPSLSSGYTTPYGAATAAAATQGLDSAEGIQQNEAARDVRGEAAASALAPDTTGTSEDQGEETVLTIANGTVDAAPDPPQYQQREGGAGQAKGSKQRPNRSPDNNERTRKSKSNSSKNPSNSRKSSSGNTSSKRASNSSSSSSKNSSPNSKYNPGKHTNNSVSNSSNKESCRSNSSRKRSSDPRGSSSNPTHKNSHHSPKQKAVRGSAPGPLTQPLPQQKETVPASDATMPKVASARVKKEAKKKSEERKCGKKIEENEREEHLCSSSGATSDDICNPSSPSSSSSSTGAAEGTTSSTAAVTNGLLHSSAAEPASDRGMLAAAAAASVPIQEVAPVERVSVSGNRICNGVVAQDLPTKKTSIRRSFFSGASSASTASATAEAVTSSVANSTVAAAAVVENGGRRSEEERRQQSLSQGQVDQRGEETELQQQQQGDNAKLAQQQRFQVLMKKEQRSRSGDMEEATRSASRRGRGAAAVSRTSSAPLQHDEEEQQHAQMITAGVRTPHSRVGSMKVVELMRRGDVGGVAAAFAALSTTAGGTATPRNDYTAAVGATQPSLEPLVMRAAGALEQTRSLSGSEVSASSGATAGVGTPPGERVSRVALAGALGDSSKTEEALSKGRGKKDVEAAVAVDPNKARSYETTALSPRTAALFREKIDQPPPHHVGLSAYAVDGRGRVAAGRDIDGMTVDATSPSLIQSTASLGRRKVASLSRIEMPSKSTERPRRASVRSTTVRRGSTPSQKQQHEASEKTEEGGISNPLRYRVLTPDQEPQQGQEWPYDHSRGGPGKGDETPRRGIIAGSARLLGGGKRRLEAQETVQGRRRTTAVSPATAGGGTDVSSRRLDALSAPSVPGFLQTSAARRDTASPGPLGKTLLGKVAAGAVALVFECGRDGVVLQPSPLVRSVRKELYHPSSELHLRRAISEHITDNSMSLPVSVRRQYQWLHHAVVALHRIEERSLFTGPPVLPKTAALPAGTNLLTSVAAAAYTDVGTASSLGGPADAYASRTRTLPADAYTSRTRTPVSAASVMIGGGRRGSRESALSPVIAGSSGAGEEAAQEHFAAGGRVAPRGRPVTQRRGAIVGTAGTVIGVMPFSGLREEAEPPLTTSYEGSTPDVTPAQQLLLADVLPHERGRQQKHGKPIGMGDDMDRLGMTPSSARHFYSCCALGWRYPFAQLTPPLFMMQSPENFLRIYANDKKWLQEWGKGWMNIEELSPDTKRSLANRLHAFFFAMKVEGGPEMELQLMAIEDRRGYMLRHLEHERTRREKQRQLLLAATASLEADVQLKRRRWQQLQRIFWALEVALMEHKRPVVCLIPALLHWLALQEKAQGSAAAVTPAGLRGISGVQTIDVSSLQFQPQKGRASLNGKTPYAISAPGWGSRLRQWLLLLPLCHTSLNCACADGRITTATEGAEAATPEGLDARAAKDGFVSCCCAPASISPPHVAEKKRVKLIDDFAGAPLLRLGMDGEERDAGMYVYKPEGGVSARLKGFEMEYDGEEKEVYERIEKTTWEELPQRYGAITPYTRMYMEAVHAGVKNFQLLPSPVYVRYLFATRQYVLLRRLCEKLLGFSLLQLWRIADANEQQLEEQHSMLLQEQQAQQQQEEEKKETQKYPGEEEESERLSPQQQQQHREEEQQQLALQQDHQSPDFMSAAEVKTHDQQMQEEEVQQQQQRQQEVQRKKDGEEQEQMRHGELQELQQQEKQQLCRKTHGKQGATVKQQQSLQKRMLSLQKQHSFQKRVNATTSQLSLETPQPLLQQKKKEQQSVKKHSPPQTRQQSLRKVQQQQTQKQLLPERQKSKQLLEYTENHKGGKLKVQQQVEKNSKKIPSSTVVALTRRSSGVHLQHKERSGAVSAPVARSGAVVKTREIALQRNTNVMSETAAATTSTSPTPAASAAPEVAAVKGALTGVMGKRARRKSEGGFKKKVFGEISRIRSAPTSPSDFPR